MNKRNKEKIAFTVQQVFNLNVMNEDNPFDYEEGFLEWLKLHKFRLRNRITNATCKLPLPVTTEQLGKVFREMFKQFEKEYAEESK